MLYELGSGKARLCADATGKGYHMAEGVGRGKGRPWYYVDSVGRPVIAPTLRVRAKASGS